MKLGQQSLQINNEFLADYWAFDKKMGEFFEYELAEQSYVERYNYLQGQNYQYEQLAQVIEGYLKRFGLTPALVENIEKLRDGAAVVVGGQQAGVLTGPLYSVHKAISVILLAKQQSEALGQPVVPLFWIAGEDHDLEEINHTYTIVGGETKKRGYGQRSKLKTMASTTKLNHEMMEQFIRATFSDFGETQYTEQLLSNILEKLADSNTFTEFFTALMHDLFKNHGLLMVDAADPQFRQMQTLYFEKLIEHNTEIAHVVVAKEKELADAGYNMPIEATMENANLFIVENDERFLLSRKNNMFIQNSIGFKATKEEMLKMANSTPQAFSNNVVTRPLMQEMTIPVLAFVGGPGELAYWATLKDAFATLQLQMPIFVPRLNITLMTRQAEVLLKQHEMSFEEVTLGKVDQKIKQFIESIQVPEAQQKIDGVSAMLEQQLEQLKFYLKDQKLDLNNIIDKNIENHKKQLQFLQTKIEQQLLVKHEVALRQFGILKAELLPNGGFQERLYNPYQYMNQYGPQLVEELLELPYTFDKTHKVVML